MFASEPLLRPEDIKAWDAWRRTCLVHAQDRRYLRRLDQTRDLVRRVLDEYENTAVMWSAGKDSTVLAHLVGSLNTGQVTVSEKDDLDYPGEVEYVEGYAKEWGLSLEVITPKVSPREWIAQNAHLIDPDEDFHSRAAGLSKECFYGLVEAANASRDVIFLGLRKGESRGRMMNRITRGLVYRKAPTKWNPEGLTVCNPLGDWSGHDVYAYLFSNNIEPLHVYRCIWLNHRDEPWRVRKSWWIPGADTRWGGIAWLRHYYPSLYQQLREWWPEASRFS